MKSNGKAKRPPTLEHRGIAHVGLKVSDVARSRRFYREVLGLRNKLRHPGVAYVSSGRDLLVLYDEKSGSSDFHFGFSVKTPQQVDEWRDWLKNNKVAVLEDVSEHNYRSVKFRDPDGYWVEISQER